MRPAVCAILRARWIFLVAVVVIGLSLIDSRSFAAADLQFPDLTGRVVDDAGILSPAERQSLNETLTAHQEATGNQLVVVTLRSLQGATIEDYGYRLGRAWGIGQKGKDNGALLIVAPGERKVRIEVGYGLEGELTDAASRLIIEQIMIPAFRSGQFGPGIVAGVGAILNVISGEPTAPSKKPASETGESFNALFPLFLLGVFVFLSWRSYRNRATSPFQRRRRSGRIPPIIWGGGGGGFGGGGGGGFSGGGGSFGGGGASGDW
jgi:uncharacterized protein